MVLSYASQTLLENAGSNIDQNLFQIMLIESSHFYRVSLSYQIGPVSYVTDNAFQIYHSDKRIYYHNTKIVPWGNAL